LLQGRIPPSGEACWSAVPQHGHRIADRHHLVVVTAQQHLVLREPGYQVVPVHDRDRIVLHEGRPGGGVEPREVALEVGALGQCYGGAGHGR
jgi:hypothetical protein